MLVHILICLIACDKDAKHVRAWAWSKSYRDKLINYHCCLVLKQRKRRSHCKLPGPGAVTAPVHWTGYLEWRQNKTKVHIINTAIKPMQ